MIYTRVILCILMVLLTACGVCAALFPLMRKTSTDAMGRKVKHEVYLWYTESKYHVNKTHYYDRVYSRHESCGGFRTTSVAGAALNVAGCGMGAIAAIIAAVHVYAKVKFDLCCTLMVLCFVTFGLFVASLVTVVFTYRAKLCVNDPVKVRESYKDQSYKLVEGFILLCVATGGFFITTFLEICSWERMRDCATSFFFFLKTEKEPFFKKNLVDIRFCFLLQDTKIHLLLFSLSFLFFFLIGYSTTRNSFLFLCVFNIWCYGSFFFFFLFLFFFFFRIATDTLLATWTTGSSARIVFFFFTNT